MSHQSIGYHRPWIPDFRGVAAALQASWIEIFDGEGIDGGVNDLSLAVFPVNYEKKLFKERAYSFLKYRSTSKVERVHLKIIKRSASTGSGSVPPINPL
ncbi:hypothetical protein EVAR_41363_1 [Eumeta japonica]|uniref:Uncharacterized protein n=1 Tax=Eumeta variegata TaxID=151549 RepID=A0A4C1XN98_EUMVA|nr:hypothetical protein EVAR_41363_1 [Eumeta japonica]